jgi:hypothetical protein
LGGASPATGPLSLRERVRVRVNDRTKLASALTRTVSRKEMELKNSER